MKESMKYEEMKEFCSADLGLSVKIILYLVLLNMQGVFKMPGQIHE
jgi:hypothetical protein